MRERRYIVSLDIKKVTRQNQLKAIESNDTLDQPTIAKNQTDFLTNHTKSHSQ